MAKGIAMMVLLALMKPLAQASPASPMKLVQSYEKIPIVSRLYEFAGASGDVERMAEGFDEKRGLRGRSIVHKVQEGAQQSGGAEFVTAEPIRPPVGSVRIYQ